MMLRREMEKYIDPTARIISDEWAAYKRIGKKYAKHETVHHTRREYVRGDVTTNGVEGWFSLLKRGIYGTFHSVSKKHLHRYVSEFQFRSNHRKVDDGERTLLAIRGAEGKRLLYRDQIAVSQNSA